jgi:hypothetical protein
MSGKLTAFVAGVLLASMFWIVLAQQSYCAGSIADWLHMGDVEECRCNEAGGHSPCEERARDGRFGSRAGLFNYFVSTGNQRSRHCDA